MRLVRVSAPKGRGAQVAKLAFDCGISDASIHSTEQHKPGETVKQKEAVDIHVSTPQSRDFVEALVRAPFYNREEFSIDVREPRSILKNTDAHAVTRPVPAPLLDVAQE